MAAELVWRLFLLLLLLLLELAAIFDRLAEEALRRELGMLLTCAFEGALLEEERVLLVFGILGP